MPATPRPLVEPRRLPVQARSTASVRAILDATLQVLVSVGQERLTTTRVAQRAGVSVGTLYQYFPNKSALLQAVLERHLNSVAVLVEQSCYQQSGCPVPQMLLALIEAFFTAKLKNPQASVALYAVSSDLNGARVSTSQSTRVRSAIARMLSTARPPIAHDVELAATVIYGAMAGISRSLLEGKSPEQHVRPLQAELIGFASAYLAAPPAGELSRAGGAPKARSASGTVA